MEALIQHKGIVALMDRANVDTDQIIPKQFLKRIERTGFGQFLFNDWRLDENGTEKPDFELNKKEFKGASILLVGDNFGCGSSREHAPWSLLDYGFKIIISTSFADIFYNNCFKNGILPMIVTEEESNKLMAEVSQNLGVQFDVKLETKTLTTANGTIINFTLDPFRQKTLVKGIDEIGASLQFQDRIEDYEEKRKETVSWI